MRAIILIDLDSCQMVLGMPVMSKTFFSDFCSTLRTVGIADKRFFKHIECCSKIGSISVAL